MLFFLQRQRRGEKSLAASSIDHGSQFLRGKGLPECFPGRQGGEDFLFPIRKKKAGNYRPSYTPAEKNAWGDTPSALRPPSSSWRKKNALLIKGGEVSGSKSPPSFMNPRGKQELSNPLVRICLVPPQTEDGVKKIPLPLSHDREGGKGRFAQFLFHQIVQVFLTRKKEKGENRESPSWVWFQSERGKKKKTIKERTILHQKKKEGGGKGDIFTHGKIIEEEEKKSFGGGNQTNEGTGKGGGVDDSSFLLRKKKKGIIADRSGGGPAGPGPWSGERMKCRVFGRKGEVSSCARQAAKGGRKVSLLGKKKSHWGKPCLLLKKGGRRGERNLLPLADVRPPPPTRKTHPTPKRDRSPPPRLTLRAPTRLAPVYSPSQPTRGKTRRSFFPLRSDWKWDVFAFSPGVFSSDGEGIEKRRRGLCNLILYILHALAKTGSFTGEVPSPFFTLSGKEGKGVLNYSYRTGE